MAGRPEPKTRSEFARMAGVSPAAITKAMQPGNQLALAYLPRGRIDAAHPAAMAYLRVHKPKAAKAAASKPEPKKSSKTGLRGRGRPKRQPTEAQQAVIARRGELAEPSDVRDLLDLTLREITTRHGSSQGFADWLTCRKLLAAIDTLEQRRQRERGELLSRALVDHHAIGWIDALHHLLLHDGAEAIAATVRDAALAGEPLEHCIKLTCGALSGHLGAASRRVRAGLRGARVPSGAVPRDESEPAPPKTPVQFPRGELAVHLEDSIRAAAPGASCEQVRALADEIAADAEQSFGAVVAAAVGKIKQAA